MPHHPSAPSGSGNGSSTIGDKPFGGPLTVVPDAVPVGDDVVLNERDAVALADCSAASSFDTPPRGPCAECGAPLAIEHVHLSIQVSDFEGKLSP